MAHRPIETALYGHRFRSRLEARWAVFFTEAEIPWEYEVDGWDIDGEWYLPDFHLPECGTWIEVKGILRPGDMDLLEKAEKVLPVERLPGCEEGPTLLIVSTIPDLDTIPFCYGEPYRMDIAWSTPGGIGYGFGTYHKNHRPWWINYREASVKPTWDASEYMPPHIEAAYRKARAARFEHGEKG